ncbi:hypothetical protein ELE36_16470 [Pseudolysobacter antarcticus]|uniref:DUF6438 domain-containing protein n=1 Tax=Pseudolysobacter antarcticus TaxID=2511995 RepID=A0A411HMW7_9GAMM|nr:DUF6438 domain-containing protein [Pseudolysobacter antarcticus]QBB71822.1 hypothetical protein ELE36_16470 [Pseudolysobacter antarcticus]
MKIPLFDFAKVLAILMLVGVSQTSAATDAQITSRLQKVLEEGPVPTDESVARTAIPIDSISLERTPCYGLCPDYSITFNKDGYAFMEGRGNTAHNGKFHAEINLHDFIRLCQLVYVANFFNLRDSYSAGWTDDTTMILIVVAGKTKKRVSDYGDVGPAQVWAMGRAIDAISTTLEWKPAENPSIQQPKVSH